MMPGVALAGGLSLSEVVRLALQQNPDIRVQVEQINIARAQQQQAAGQFDWIFSSAANYDRTVTPLPPSSSIAQSTQVSSGYSVGASKQLRNGLQMAGTLSASASQVSGSAANPQENDVTLNVSMTVPLLKGRGSELVTASEDAARLAVLRNRYELRSRTAQTLYSVLLAYWDYRTRVALRNVAQSSEQRSQSLLSSNQKLVAASEKPRADLVLLKADLADKMAARQAAELALSESRKALGRLLGMDMAGINQLAEPSDPFPPLNDAAGSLAQKLAQLSEQARQQRPDLKALDLQAEGTRRQLRAAIDKMKPQLDLNVGVGYGRASEGGSRYGFITEPGRNQPEPSVFAHLNYQFPLENNQASGAAKELSSTLLQLEIRQRDLADSIGAGVDSALQALSRNAEQMRVVQEGLVLYEQAVNQEIIKQRNGISTLIDVVNIEGRYVSAQVGFLQLQLAYANALARLRFETGTFLPRQPVAESGNDQFSLDMADLAGPGPLLDSFK